MLLLGIAVKEQAHGVRAHDDDFRFLLDEKTVPGNIIGSLGHFGITSLAVMANIETEGARFREMLKVELGLSAETDMQAWISIAEIVEVWGAARQRITAREPEINAATRKVDLVNWRRQSS